MFSVSVDSHFSATHRVRFRDGRLEPLHGHDWKVRATFATEALDETSMVVDFEEVQAALDKVATSFHHRNLNDHEAMGGSNPTAERIAEVIFDRLRALGWDSLTRVEVTEAPGCRAILERARVE